jgi:hypothetical protein
MVEFWYFDTNISEQGEELYIYMNARGESVKENENLKASLLAGLSSDIEKETYGRKWEDWQDFFWINRREENNSTADKGFNEFLRWVLIIKVLNEAELNDVHYAALLDGEIIPDGLEDVLCVQDIDHYISALQYIFSEFRGIASGIEQQYGSRVSSYSTMIPKHWLKASKMDTYPLSQINLFRLLPVLEYVKLHKEHGRAIEPLPLFRFIRYFYNLQRSDNVSKTTRDALPSGIKTANLLYQSGHADVAFLPDMDVSRTIVSATERNKLLLYRLQTDGDLRVRFEASFWKAEDFKRNDGDISFILTCIGEDPNTIGGGMSVEKLDEFDQYEDLFEVIFDKPEDLLRRAILSFGEYGSYVGRTPSLQADRYTLGGSDDDWLKILREDNTQIKVLMKYLIANGTTKMNWVDRLSDRIGFYKEEVTKGDQEKDWRYFLITRDGELEYCERKLFCWGDDETVYLLRSLKATKNNFRKLNMTE